MAYANRKLNLAMGGGGVKGIAYIGVFDVMERKGYKAENIAGVSAGSLAGTLAAAGYDAVGMWYAMDRFDFGKIRVDSLPAKVPAIKRFIELIGMGKVRGEADISTFLAAKTSSVESESVDPYRGNILGNIVTYCMEGCLFDGDLLEEWLFETLARKGVRTFADLRGGRADESNPRGYKIRMTGVDCSRTKVVVLPDDMAFYGVDPDSFEVAKAVRISTSVPFAFKPVEIRKNEGGKTKIYNLVDGGVLDSFPGWLIGGTDIPAVGFKFHNRQNKLFGFDTPLSVLKGMVSAVHDIGTPKSTSDNIAQLGEINAAKIDFLDFGLEGNEKRYLVNAGRQTAINLFNVLEYNDRNYSRYGMPLAYSRFGRKS